MSVAAKPVALTVMQTPTTRRPSSGLVKAVCWLSTSLTTPTLTVVLGATEVGWPITTVDPTLSEAMVTEPVEPAQVVVDVDCTAPMVMVGIVARWTLTLPTDAVPTDMPGQAVVVTPAHSAVALTRPGRLATHGVFVADDEVVETGPVSGEGGMLTIGFPAATRSHSARMTGP